MASEWVEYGDSDSGTPPVKKRDEGVASLIADMKAQTERDNKLHETGLRVLAEAGLQSREFEALQPALNEFNLRHSVKSKPIESQESSSTRETNEDDSGPRQILRIPKGSGMDGFRMISIRELEDKLNSTKLPPDPNMRAAPAAYKAGYQAGLKEAIQLLRNPIYIEGNR